MTWQQLALVFAAFKVGGVIGWLYGCRIDRMAQLALGFLDSDELRDLIEFCIKTWHAAQPKPAAPHPDNCGCPEHEDKVPLARIPHHAKCPCPEC